MINYKKYLIESKLQKFEIHPTELVGFSQEADIKAIEVVLRPMSFIDKSQIWLDEKTAQKFKRQMGAGVTLRKIHNDKAVYIVDPKKAHLEKIEKFYDKLDNLAGGWVDMEMLIFVYVENVDADLVSNFYLTKVSNNYTG